MKINSIILVLFLCCNLQLMGQESKENGWSAMLKGGMLTSNYEFSPLSSSKQLLGYELENKINSNLDLEFKYHLQKVAMKIGVSYIGRGYRQSYNWITPDQNSLNDPSLPSYTNMNSRYLNWSLSFGYSVLKGNKLEITPFANFIYGGLVSLKELTVYGNDSNNTKETDLVCHKFSSTILATSFSVDFTYNVTEKVGVLFSPYFLHTITTIDEKLIEKSRHSIGGNIGVVYSFGK